MIFSTHRLLKRLDGLILTKRELHTQVIYLNDGVTKLTIFIAVASTVRICQAGSSGAPTLPLCRRGDGKKKSNPCRILLAPSDLCLSGFGHRAWKALLRGLGLGYIFKSGLCYRGFFFSIYGIFMCTNTKKYIHLANGRAGITMEGRSGRILVSLLIITHKLTISISEKLASLSQTTISHPHSTAPRINGQRKLGRKTLKETRPTNGTSIATPCTRTPKQQASDFCVIVMVAGRIAISNAQET